MNRGLDRRAFLGVGGAALICTIGGKTVALRNPEDVCRGRRVRALDERPTAAAAQKTKPKTPAADVHNPKDAGRRAVVRHPGAAAGRPGARVLDRGQDACAWDVAPTGWDEWMDHADPEARARSRAFAYQPYSDGFADAARPRRHPRPDARGRGRRRPARPLPQRRRDTSARRVTMHPHGVRYTPDYDGAYYGDYTRVGGFIAPGEEFTYTWEAHARLGRRLAVPRPRAQRHAQHAPRPVRRDHRPREGRQAPRRRDGPLLPRVRRRRSPSPAQAFSASTGASRAGNTPDDPRQGRAGRRLPRRSAATTCSTRSTSTATAGATPAATFVDNPSSRADDSVTARWTEDNPGRWLYHCHVFSHMDAGMAGWYLVEP